MTDLEKEFYPLGRIITLVRDAEGTNELEGAKLEVIRMRLDNIETRTTNDRYTAWYFSKLSEDITWKWLYKPGAIE